MVVVKPLLTPADVEQMIATGEIPLDAMFELVDGEILWLSPTEHYHGQVCGAIIGELWPFAKRIGARVFDGQTGFKVDEQRQQLRSPDISLVTKERLDILPHKSFASAAPDLAVEVLSQEQQGKAYARAKIREYFAAGAKVVWLVDPDAQTVRVYEPNKGEFSIYPAGSNITLDQIAPGFSVPVRSFFP